MSKTEKLRCYAIGEESLLVQCVEILLDKGHAICGIVSREAPIVEWASSRDIPTLDPKSDYSAELKKEPFDYLFSITHLSLIPEEVLALPRKGAVNFHDGPLPHYAGLNVPVWAILNGETQHGVTWHLIDGGVDEGAVIDQRLFDIADDETALHDLGHNQHCLSSAGEIAGAGYIAPQPAHGQVDPGIDGSGVGGQGG